MTTVIAPPAPSPSSHSSEPSTHSSEPSTQESSSRLRLRPRGPVTGFVDGGWWPHSNDLAAELPDLLTRMKAAGYRTSRVTYNLDFWAPAPRRVTVDGQVIRLGGFRSQNAGVLVLVDSANSRRTELLVVPPDTTADRAERDLTLAATSDNDQRAAEILDAA